ncbi:hypothetical protein C8R46DRAFT_1052446 [Mycena filopes]|nr:hypothetical protein C8R46DRAFT_1052446 [Mycena filopes]
MSTPIPCPTSPSNIPANCFASYDYTSKSWYPLFPRYQLLSSIITNIRNALLAHPERVDTIRRHYYFIPLEARLTPEQSGDRRLLKDMNAQFYDFALNHFPQICLHNNLENELQGNSMSPAHGRRSEPDLGRLMGLHIRNNNNTTKMFVDVKTIEALQNADDPVPLTILMVSTLYHELAHSFWTHCHGVSGWTPKTLKWSGSHGTFTNSSGSGIDHSDDVDVNIDDPNSLLGESGFVLEGMLMGCEVWPNVPAETPNEPVLELLWMSPMFMNRNGAVVLKDEKIQSIVAHFNVHGYLGAPLCSLRTISTMRFCTVIRAETRL